MKKVIIGILALALAFLAQRMLMDKFKQKRASAQLVHGLEKATGFKFNILSADIDREQELKITGFDISTPNGQAPFIRIEELTSSPRLQGKVTVFKETKVKGILLPFLNPQAEIPFSPLNDLTDKFLNISQSRRDLNDSVFRQTKALVFEYQKLIENLSRGDGTGAVYKREKEQAISFLKREVAFEFRKPILRDGINNEEIFLELLRPAIEGLATSLGQSLALYKEKQLALRAKEKPSSGIKIDEILIHEKGDLVGKVQHLNTIEEFKSPLNIRIQGDYNKYGIKGADLRLKIKDGKNLGVVLKSNFMELPINLKDIKMNLEVEGQSFAINNQVNLSFEVTIKDFKLESDEHALQEKIISDLMKTNPIKLKVISKTFEVENKQNLENMVISIEGLPNKEVLPLLEKGLIAHAEELLIAEAKSSERYQEYLALKQKLEKLIETRP